MRVIEVSMEQRWNEKAGETGDPQNNPPTNGIVRHESLTRKSGSDPGGELSYCKCCVEMITGIFILYQTESTFSDREEGSLWKRPTCYEDNTKGKDGSQG
ncbi:hypothetical protein PR048_026065 [Dryococelus australis]|uniref:Uncharacterized protein n=1 Tax=Dryococelus australis TaxID=614101 RepID=A0ABQ9GKA8_9NEOP|nr:hypothetical protein PR048_026065 [Dryococelus australis]